MEIFMTVGKVTKNGFVRFEEAKKEGDFHGKNIYLSPQEVKELGDPKSIKVTIEAA